MFRAHAMLLLIHFPLFLSTAVLLFVSLRSIVKWILKRQKLKAIPGPDPRFLIGNLHLFAQEKRRLVSGSRTAAYFNVFRKLSRQYQSEGIYKIFYTDFQVIVALCNFETADFILSSSHQIDKSIQYKLLKNWLGDSLLTSSGDVWRRKRQILSRVFHSKTIKSFIPVMRANADKFCQHLTNDRTDILALALESTLLTVMETMLGYEEGESIDTIQRPIDGTNEYIDALHQYCIHYIDRLSNPLMWIESLYRRTHKGKQVDKCIVRMKKFTKKMINHRISEAQETTTNNVTADASENQSTTTVGGGRETRTTGSFLQTLLKYFPLRDVRGEVDTFIFAGHETTGLALFYTLLLIGQHPEVQQRLHHEIDSWDIRGTNCRPESDIDASEVCEGEEVMLNKTTSFLDSVIRESLRLYPPVARIGRKINSEIRIRGSESGIDYAIPEGTTVTIDIFQIHRDPAIFTNPHTFDPNRFYNINEAGKDVLSGKNVFMPFSLGPRSCIGSKYALLEIKIFLIQVLRRFTIVSKTTTQELELGVEIVLKPNNSSVEILFVEREQR